VFERERERIKRGWKYLLLSLMCVHVLTTQAGTCGGGGGLGVGVGVGEGGGVGCDAGCGVGVMLGAGAGVDVGFIDCVCVCWWVGAHACVHTL